MEEENKLDIKIVIDKKRNRVVYAKGNQDFVDVLFSLLTLPLGVIVKLLDKKSGVGCIDQLYDSIENIDTQYFETKACKTMLLSPHSESFLDNICHSMKLQYNEKWRGYKAYVCPSWNDDTNNCTGNKSQLLFSLVPNSICSCGRTMEYDRTKVSRPISDKGKDGIFVKEGLYMVTDDLDVMPASQSCIRNLLNNLKISDYGVLEKIHVKFGIDEVKKLLRTSLTSNSPLTDAFNDEIQKTWSFFKCLEEKINSFFRYEVGWMEDEVTGKVTDGLLEEGANLKKFTIDLFTERVTNEPIYVIAGGDFVDLLFSFLTFPLGSIMKLLLLKSERKFLNRLRGAYFLFSNILSLKSYKIESNSLALQNAKLASYYGTDNQLLGIKESDDFLFSRKVERVSPIDQQVHEFDMCCINPKLHTPKSELGGKYMRDEYKYLITENMEVLPLSTVSISDVLKNSKINMKDLEEQKFDITEVEAVELLRSCLLYKKSLNVALENLLEDKISEASFASFASQLD